MAAAATKKQQQPPAAAGAQVIDPKFEWAEKAGSFVLRLVLPGFRKDDFRVQVDGAGRLTVRGARPGTGAASTSSFQKVFQLPSAASIDDIAGRFEAGVLTLTVPKRAGAGDAAAPTSIEEIKRKQPGVSKESKPKEEEIAKEDALKKAMEEATCKAQEKKQQEEDEKARARKQEQQKPAPAPLVKKEEEVKPKAPQAAAASPHEKPAAPKPEAATGGADKPKEVVTPMSLAERVRRRGKEEHPNAAPMAAAKRAKTDGEKKAPLASWGGGWKERVQGELKVLTDMKWADGVVEAARKNKEVVAIGIAAFSLGFLVSHKLFRK